jgi:uncharacterized protein (DUF39 family)
MTALAAMMVDAGCLAVVGLMENGPGVLMVDDRTEPSEVAKALREYADAIEGLTDADMIGKVDVVVEDDDDK